MTLFSFFFGGNKNDVDVVSEVLTKLKNVEHVIKSDWTTWWDRVYMQEVRRNNGTHPTMEVFKSTVNKTEMAVVTNDDGTFTVICRLGYDESATDLDNVLAHMQKVLDLGDNKEVAEAA